MTYQSISERDRAALQTELKKDKEFRKALLQLIVINTIGAIALVAASLTFPKQNDPNAPLMVTIAVTGVWILCSVIFSLRLVKVRKAIAARLEAEVREKENKAHW